MRQFFVLFQKENLESWRSFKWLWMPITFILLGVMEPLSQYYLPQILDSLGDLPEGAVIKLPTPTETDVLIAVLGNFNMLGMLILVLAAMGTIAGERKSGVAAMILVKPVSYASFVVSKWLSTLLLMWVSYIIGLLAAWYYTGLLFEFIPIAAFFGAMMMYGLWLSFAITITIFYNTFLKTPGFVGFSSLATIIAISTLSGPFSKWVSWSPGLLLNYTSEYLTSNTMSENSTGAIFLTIVGMAVLLGLGVSLFRRRELT